MVLVKARVKIFGFRNSVEDLTFVDTGSTLTLIDEEIANYIGIKFLNKIVKVIVANGHEVNVKLAIVNKFIIEDEELPYAHVGIFKFPDELRERLRKFGLCDWCILGLTTLELLQLIPDTTTGTLRKVPGLLI